MIEISKDQLYAVVYKLADVLRGSQYAIRGTAGLVLQGYDMQVQDIDIVCDEGTALASNYILKDYLVKPVAYSETDKYKSFFGEFVLDGIKVEIMGNWQIKNDKGEWSDKFTGKDCVGIDVGGYAVNVTSVDTELKMFAYMGRWNAFHKIKGQLKNGNGKVDNSQPGLL